MGTCSLAMGEIMFEAFRFGSAGHEVSGALRAYAPLYRIDAYWQALSGGTGIPAAADIDPRGIGHDLRHAFVLERISKGHCRVRVAGCVLGDVMEGDARGLPFSRGFEPASQTPLARVIEDTFAVPALTRLTVKTSRHRGIFERVGEVRLFPLCNEDKVVTRLLGAIAFAGKEKPPLGALTLTGSFLRGASLSKSEPRLRPTHVPYLRVLCDT